MSVNRDLVIDFVAGGGPHFTEHLLPVYQALPPSMRGSFYTEPKFAPAKMPERADAGGDLWLTCSYGDLMLAHFAELARPIIFMEHGAGFTFEGSDGLTLDSYSGSLERPNVVQFLNVNEYALNANARSHPYAAQAVIGSPKMDRWYPPPKLHGRKRIAMAWHWDALVAPGTRSALEHYRDALPELAQWCAKQGYELVGHSHPRIETEVKFLCLSLGIPYITLEEMYRTASMLIADATSVAYEFASLGRPVLSLNCPAYREEKDDGLRFWQHIPGLQIDEPSELVGAASTAQVDPTMVRFQREEAVEAVYPVRGDAAATAVDAIEYFIDNAGTGYMAMADTPIPSNERLRKERSRQIALMASMQRARKRPADRNIERELFHYKDCSRRSKA